MKIPHIKLVNPFQRPSSTGSSATALTARPVRASGAQGSGNLQASEAVSYGSVPLQWAKPTVPNARNVGVPLHQHTHFGVPGAQVVNPKLPRSARALDQR